MVRRHRWMRGAWAAMAAIGLGGALVKAASLTSRYDAEMQRLRGEWRAAQQAEGLDPRRGAKALYAAYPTPEITLCKSAVVAPGASAAVSCTGRFGAQARFLVDHDHVTLTPGTTTASTFAATAAVSADATPAYVRLFAYAPVSGAWSRRGALVIGAAPTFALTASNGWSIALTPDGSTWTVTGDSASIGYRAEYFKAGTPASFEKMSGSLTVSANDRPGQAYTFSMMPGGTGSAMEEYQALMAKMADPAAFAKLSARDRAAFEKKMEDVGDRMTREMEAMTANPAALQEKQAQFGCGSISLTVAGAQAHGGVSCGQKVGYLTLDGSRK